MHAGVVTRIVNLVIRQTVGTCSWRQRRSRSNMSFNNHRVAWNNTITTNTVTRFLRIRALTPKGIAIFEPGGFPGTGVVH